MRKILFPLICFVQFCAFAENGKILEFKYKEGDNYSLVSTVVEDVRVNGRLNHRAEIVSRVTERVGEVDEFGRGRISATFMTTENSTSSNAKESTFKWGEDFESEFWRSKTGKFEIDDAYFMPVIRDMPIFPEKELFPGEEWTAEGYEAEDLRRDLNVQKPFKVPFVAKYKYERDEDGVSSDSSKKKKTFQVISAKYNLFYETPAQENPASDYPVTTMGYSYRTIWWDNEKGQIDHYEENFRIIMETYLGNNYQFSGKTKVECTEYKTSATDENLQIVEEKIQDLGLTDVSVSKTEQGLSISMENIQFLADSAVLQESEKNKILKIAQILSSYPDNDLLVVGHTARVGSEESCQILSEERADSVGDFLIDTGVRRKNHVFTKGFGSKIPVATNKTEDGRAKNRRVEIIILDK